MVPEGINFALFCVNCVNFMPKGAIFKKECKKVLFNSFVLMQFSLFDQLFFPAKKQKCLSKN